MKMILNMKFVFVHRKLCAFSRGCKKIVRNLNHPLTSSQLPGWTKGRKNWEVPLMLQKTFRDLLRGSCFPLMGSGKLHMNSKHCNVLLKSVLKKKKRKKKKVFLLKEIPDGVSLRYRKSSLQSWLKLINSSCNPVFKMGNWRKKSFSVYSTFHRQHVENVGCNAKNIFYMPHDNGQGSNQGSKSRYLKVSWLKVVSCSA